MNNQRFDKGCTIEEILSQINIDELSKDLPCFKKMGYLTSDYKEQYQDAYDFFEKVNSNVALNGIDTKEDNRIKGKALEDLVSLLFIATGGYYEVYRNAKNGTNEVDLILKFSGKGKHLAQVLKHSKIICECKNYKSSISVTYVGKFCSLMQTTNCNLGIMFSYNGFSGESWGSAKGLTKKIYLLKERPEDKLYILEFKKEDFCSILKGKSIFDILDDKCMELELGVDDITKYITEHPNEKELEM